MYQELKQALREGTLYDFIANNGYLFSKDDLIEIIKELSYSAYEVFGEKAYIEVEHNMLNNMNENDTWDD